LFALDVFCEVLKTRPDALFLVAGEGELRHRMEEVCHLRGLDYKVRLLGNKADIQELYDVFDVLVFPSRYEGLPLTAVESQANGLPIVMSTAISNEACIVPELIARLPLTCSVKQWASALIAHGSRELSLRGQDNTNLIAAGYEIKHSANTLCSWYESLLA
jgi:glycosyltransferase involved in cell wall biosynthesis